MLRINHNLENGITHVAPLTIIVSGVVAHTIHGEEVLCGCISVIHEGAEGIRGTENGGRSER